MVALDQRICSMRYVGCIATHLEFQSPFVMFAKHTISCYAVLKALLCAPP
jgi:hypothetical protein